MRAGLNTVQQTLTPEAAAILNDAIAEACRRGHGQTTPLHVAATLLEAPASHLRQACIRSHPNSSHPLQCRALELCFRVALDRLPAAQGLAAGTEPPISNALMAALKRAQAHQRRGCPEQQQQPLLAVKVELEQLIVSILDDPSVSRVMREASFSSPAVKATIEQSINMANSSHSLSSTMGAFRFGGSVGVGAHSYLGNFSLSSSSSSRASNNHNSFERDDASSRLLRSSYFNPSYSSVTESHRIQDVRQLMETLLSAKKRNPVLVGDAEAHNVFNEFVQSIEKVDSPEPLRGVQILPLEPEISSFCSGDKDEEYVSARFVELDQRIEESLKTGVILNVGDFKWFVEQPKAVAGSAPTIGLCATASSIMQQVVLKLGNLLSKYRASGRTWVIGRATCETYLRCLVYHRTMEVEWDLHAFNIVGKPAPGLFPRLLCNPVDSLPPIKGITPITTNPRRVYETSSSFSKLTCCSQCMASYEEESALLEEEEKLASSSKTADHGQQSLPLWLGNSGNSLTGTDSWQAKSKDPPWNRKLEELQIKWNEKCSSLHHQFHAFRPLSLTEQSQEPLRARTQGIDKNGKGQTENGIEKLLQNPFRIEKCFPISLDASWRPSQINKHMSPNVALSDGTGVEPFSRTSVALHSVNGHAPSLQSSMGLEAFNKNCYGTSAMRVTTDLALGRSSAAKVSPALDPLVVEGKQMQEELLKDRLKDTSGCVTSTMGLAFNIPAKIASLGNESRLQGSSVQSMLAKQGWKESSIYQPLLDSDELKNIYKIFEEKVGWQQEAAYSVASVAVQHKSRTVKRRGLSSRGDVWLLFLGLDRVGKRKMAATLAEVVCGSEKKLISFKLGSQDSGLTSSWCQGYNENDKLGFRNRGKTTLDRIAEIIRQNRLCVLLLEDVDQADQMTRTSLVWAMEKGRLSDSNGRDIDLGRMVFVMTASTGHDIDKVKVKVKEMQFTEDGIAVACCSRPMQITVENAGFGVFLSQCKRVSIIDFVEYQRKDEEQVSLCLGIGNKRKADCIKSKLSQTEDAESAKKPKEPLISLDLNLSVEENDVADCSTASQGHTEICQGSRDSSDLTIEEQGLKGSSEFIKNPLPVDETVVFKAFDFDTMADKILEAISSKFFSIIGSQGLMEIDKKAVEQMLAFTWFNCAEGMKLFENWIEKVLEPSLRQVSTMCSISADTVIKLLVDKNAHSGETTPPGTCLPSSIPVNKCIKPNSQNAGAGGPL